MRMIPVGQKQWALLEVKSIFGCSSRNMSCPWYRQLNAMTFWISMQGRLPHYCRMLVSILDWFSSLPDFPNSCYRWRSCDGLWDGIYRHVEENRELSYLPEVYWLVLPLRIFDDSYWLMCLDSELFDLVPPKHLMAGGLSMDDVSRRISQFVFKYVF